MIEAKEMEAKVVDRRDAFGSGFVQDDGAAVASHC
jgi:hypothetical protein